MKFKKMYTLIVENSCNFSNYLIIKILLFLYSTHMISKNQDTVVFYVNNHIYCINLMNYI